MSALDEVIDVYRDGADSPVSDAARAELALLRRCRDAVVRLAVDAPDGTPWWYYETTLGYGCSQCSSGSSGNPTWPEPSEVVHVDTCPALAIDALAKEVRGG